MGFKNVGDEQPADRVLAMLGAVLREALT